MKAVRKFYLQVFRHTLLPLDQEDLWEDISTLGIHPDTVLRLADLGIVEIHMGRVHAHQSNRIKKLLRLRQNLGVNLAGATIILDLLNRIETLQDEVERLKRK